MRKTFSSLFILLFLVIGCTKSTDFKELVFRGGMYYTTDNDLFTGKISATDENGTEIFKGYIHKGLRSGKWTFYYASGTKQMSGYYKGGLKDGKWTIWNEKGVISGEEFYKDGNLLTK